MTIITRSRADNFAVVPNAVTEDNRLSFEARGVLCYLLAKPNNWQVKIADIQAQGNFGRDKTYRILKELREVGYLLLVVKRNEKAQIISQDYIVYDVADVAAKPVTENTEIANNKKLLPEKPDTAKPDEAKPDTANTDGIIRTELITNTELIIKTENKSREKNSRKQSQDKIFEDEFFDFFWPAYPNKVGKPAALKSFLKARREASLEEIMEGLERYKETKPTDRQWLNPSTFLNQARWADEPASTEPRNAGNRNNQQPFGNQVSNAIRQLGAARDAKRNERQGFADFSSCFETGQRIDASREDKNSGYHQRGQTIDLLPC